MKMKRKNKITQVLLLVLSLFVITACGKSEKSTNEKEAEDHEMEAGDDHKMDGDDHDEEAGEHEHEAMTTSLSSDETTVWLPSGEGADVIKKDFHFIVGNIDDVNPEVVSEGGESVLVLNPTGSQSAFVFHQQMGNVGIAITLKRSNFNGDLKIIHHAKNGQTYEFVAINGNKMDLGRIVDGVEKLFDNKDFKSNDNEWITIRVSAAGSHFKGYLGDENITHGHGDEMEAGYVGIMTSGTGKITIRSIEVTPLEAE
jgi:hypothetical protein